MLYVSYYRSWIVALAFMQWNALIAIVKPVKTVQEFDEVVQQYPFTVVKFYAPWCPGCTALEEPFGQVTQDPELSDILFLSINVEELRELSNRYGITSIPTLVYLMYGKEHAREVRTKSLSSFTKDLKTTAQKYYALAVEKAAVTKEKISETLNEAQERVTEEVLPASKNLFASAVASLKSILMRIVNFVKNIFGMQ